MAAKRSSHTDRRLYMRTVFVDIETGGLEIGAAVIQIAAVAVDAQLEELEAKEWKLQFVEQKADPVALRINHYSAERWASEAKPEADVVAALCDMFCRYADVRMVSKRSHRPYHVARLGGHNI